MGFQFNRLHEDSNGVETPARDLLVTITAEGMPMTMASVQMLVSITMQ